MALRAAFPSIRRRRRCRSCRAAAAGSSGSDAASRHPRHLRPPLPPPSRLRPGPLAVAPRALPPHTPPHQRFPHAVPQVSPAATTRIAHRSHQRRQRSRYFDIGAGLRKRARLRVRAEARACALAQPRIGPCARTCACARRCAPALGQKRGRDGQAGEDCEARASAPDGFLRRRCCSAPRAV